MPKAGRDHRAAPSLRRVLVAEVVRLPPPLVRLAVQHLDLVHLHVQLVEAVLEELPQLRVVLAVLGLDPLYLLPEQRAHLLGRGPEALVGLVVPHPVARRQPVQVRLQGAIRGLEGALELRAGLQAALVVLPGQLGDLLLEDQVVLAQDLEELAALHVGHLGVLRVPGDLVPEPRLHRRQRLLDVLAERLLLRGLPGQGLRQLPPERRRHAPEVRLQRGGLLDALRVEVVAQAIELFPPRGVPRLVRGLRPQGVLHLPGGALLPRAVLGRRLLQRGHRRLDVRDVLLELAQLVPDEVPLVLHHLGVLEVKARQRLRPTGVGRALLPAPRLVGQPPLPRRGRRA
eukprot:CAMPEP_0179256808 /NCGR_PEP_ID=MMETSP0797-20121207/24459_1 /TAXON_ID=47934 /ORGANISM="Dinophysis acuminata, Strain DAEP01" /LENGTH=342 /DNA_ID=CAMNT_0020964757 /DNA_START=26 /DNA_END=1050 /DNA_ORIENTATION=+